MTQLIPSVFYKNLIFLVPFLSATWCLHLQCVSAAAWAVQLALHSLSGLYPKAQTLKEGRSSLLCAGHGLYRDTCCVLTRTVWRHLLCGGTRAVRRHLVQGGHGLCADMGCVWDMSCVETLDVWDTCCVEDTGCAKPLLCAEMGCVQTLAMCRHGLCRDTCRALTWVVWRTLAVCRHRLCRDTCYVQTRAVQRHLLCAGHGLYRDTLCEGDMGCVRHLLSVQTQVVWSKAC